MHKIRNAISAGKTRLWIAAMTASTLLCGVAPVHAEDPTATSPPDGGSGIDQYVIWPDNFSRSNDAQHNAQAFAIWGYDLFFALGLLFFSIKLALAFYNWMTIPTDSHHDGQKKELFSEMLEPLKGLAMFMVGALLAHMLLQQFVNSGALPDGSQNLLGE